MKETILITGAHGLIARHLVLKLRTDYQIKLLSTHPDQKGMLKWDTETGYIDPEALTGVDHILHLAGARFYDGKPMTEERKVISHNSRAGAALLLLEQLKANGQTLKSFISASAASYYDFKAGVNVIDEDGPKASDANAELCVAWEAAADEFKRCDIARRVVKLRSSAVLATDGGLLSQMLVAYQNNPALLDKQRNDSYLPWIHIDDMTALFAAVISNEHYEGIYNNAADEPVTMAMFIIQLINLLENKNSPISRPAYQGVQINSGRVKALGFNFKYSRLDDALKDLLPG